MMEGLSLPFVLQFHNFPAAHLLFYSMSSPSSSSCPARGRKEYHTIMSKFITIFK